MTHPASGVRRTIPGAFALLVVTFLLSSPLAAQTTIAIANSGFESPSPSTFPDYTIGATGWTSINPLINAGTFSPGIAGTTPAAIDGSQVGYTDGFGGLQQVLTDTFLAGQTYTFSVFIGFRSDEANSASGTGAITLGYFTSGTFTTLSTQATTASRGQFNFVTGTFQPTGAALGQPIALRLTSTDSFQSIFDQAQMSYSAIPEPAAYGVALGAGVLGIAAWRRRGRRGRRRRSAALGVISQS
jgi:hypothetical protein